MSPPLSPVVLVGFLVLAALLSGCRSSSEHGAPAASSSSATQSPIAVQPAEGTRYRVTATILVGARPAGVAVDSSTHTVYVANGDGTLSVIDGTARTLGATVPVGKLPVDLTVNPKTHTVYVANVNEGTASVIGGAARTVTATVPIGENVGGLAGDLGNGTLYVTTEDDN